MIPQTDAMSPLQPRPCPRWGVIDTPAVGPGSGPHTARARWAPGGCFPQWTLTRPPEERQARREQARPQAMAARPSSQAPLASLQALGDVDPVPASLWEASERIDALVHGEVVR